MDKYIMKSILKCSLGSLLLTAAVSIPFTACSDDKEFAELSSAYYPQSVTMILPDALQSLLYVEEASGTTVLPLVKGEQVALGYQMDPENVTFKEVKWTSSNEEIAKVDAEGKLTAVSGDGTGYSIIQVAPEAYYSGSNIAGTLKVLVVNSLVKADEVILSSPVDEVYAGETLQLSVSILPENATYRTVKWSSSDESVATVDNNGLVVGLVNNDTHAKVIISATSLDGGDIVASKEITVNQIVQPQSVSISKDYSAEKGYLFAIADKKVSLKYTTTPEDCTKSLIQWTSSDNTIATIQGGIVTFNQEGIFGDVTIKAFCPETG